MGCRSKNRGEDSLDAVASYPSVSTLKEQAGQLLDHHGIVGSIGFIVQFSSFRGTNHGCECARLRGRPRYRDQMDRLLAPIGATDPL